MTRPKFTWPEVIRHRVILPCRYDYGGGWAWPFQEVTLVGYPYHGPQYVCRNGWEMTCIQEMVNKHYDYDKKSIDDYADAIIGRAEVARRFFDLMQPTEEERERYRKAIDGR